MIITVFTRHSADCPDKDDRYWKRCRCPKWLYLEHTRKRITAKTRSWQEAEQNARQMEQEHARAATASCDDGEAPASSDVKTVRQAVTHFLEDKAEQNLSRNWLQKYRRELPHFANWCEHKVRYIELTSINLLGLENYRKTWNGAAATRRKRQERLRSFFRYCVRHRWIAHNVAADLEAIKIKTAPKLPFTREQFAHVMAAVERYHPRRRNSEWRRRRAVAMLLLLRWSGLRINDAAKLERSRLTSSGSLLLYMQKTGEPVYVPLPPNIAKMLRELSESREPPLLLLERHQRCLITRHPVVVYPQDHLPSCRAA